MKYKFLSLAFGLSLLALFPVGIFAAGATLSLEPSTGTFNQGCNFILKVILATGGIETDGTDAVLAYDPTRFNAVSITNGPVYPDFPGNNIDAAGGKITISGLASVSTPFSATGTLATINFSVLSNAPAGLTQITFDFDPNNKGKTTDSNVVKRVDVVDVLNSVVNGSYTIGTGACGTVSATSAPRGGTSTATATPSARVTPYPTTKSTLPDGGTPQLTSAVAIIGGILVVLGILGLALL